MKRVIGTPVSGSLDRNILPQPIFDAKPELVELYYFAWQKAWDHVYECSEAPASKYIDEAFDPAQIWIWDTCFMAHFCKYAPADFPGIESLKNFYAPMHDGVTSPLAIHILDNPPLFAWTELEYYKLTGDKIHLEELINRHQYLQKHFEWFDTVQPDYVLPNSPTTAPVCLKRIADGYHWEGGRSGMDNTPRGRRGQKAIDERPNNPNMLWVDAIAQQGLSALCIARLARELGYAKAEQKYQGEYEKLKSIINEFYWNEEDGAYYDIHVDTKEHMKVLTPASFWPMLAEMCSPEQAERMVDLVKDSDVFGGDKPWVTLARNDADFVEDCGDYWRGAVWLPTAYMGIKALGKYGYYELANETAAKVLTHMLATYKDYEPHTIWECYSPSKAQPAKHNGKRVRPDFCGWSALGPISMFIENVLGFHTIDASAKRIEWNLHQPGRHGITNLCFGDITTDIVADGNGNVEVKTNQPYTLVIDGVSYDINAGKNIISIS